MLTPLRRHQELLRAVQDGPFNRLHRPGVYRCPHIRRDRRPAVLLQPLTVKPGKDDIGLHRVNVVVQRLIAPTVVSKFSREGSKIRGEFDAAVVKRPWREDEDLVAVLGHAPRNMIRSDAVARAMPGSIAHPEDAEGPGQRFIPPPISPCHLGCRPRAGGACVTCFVGSRHEVHLHTESRIAGVVHNATDELSDYLRA